MAIASLAAATREGGGRDTTEAADNNIPAGPLSATMQEQLGSRHGVNRHQIWDFTHGVFTNRG